MNRMAKPSRRRRDRASMWNFADVWEAVADTIPDAPAQRQGERVIT